MRRRNENPLVASCWTVKWFNYLFLKRSSLRVGFVFCRWVIFITGSNSSGQYLLFFLSSFSEKIDFNK